VLLEEKECDRCLHNVSCRNIVVIHRKHYPHADGKDEDKAKEKVKKRTL